MSARVLTGDCRSVLATLPDASVQCCVTSPPYANLRDYGHPDQIGAEATAEEYISEQVNVFRLVRRVLRDDGTLWLNLGDGMQDKQLRMIPARVALALQADGWVLRSDIIWAKPNPMPESCRDRPTSSHEHVFLLSKRASYYYDAGAIREQGVIPAGTLGAKGSAERYAEPGVNSRPPEYKVYDGERNARNVWTIATTPFPGAHFAVMASELAERCIKAGTSERGQCPHCGSPWARKVERTGVVDAAAKGSRFDVGKTGNRDGADRTQAGERFLKVETGWQPSCACPEHTPVPQTVLDPFAGAGTTLLVADRLGRNGIGIELNPAYADLARDRLRGDSPLFAEVA